MLSFLQKIFFTKKSLAETSRPLDLLEIVKIKKRKKQKDNIFDKIDKHQILIANQDTHHVYSNPNSNSKHEEF
jgi:hypothetical protein